MNGCLKGLFRLGCAVVIVAVIALIYWFRAPLMQTAAHWFGRSQALPSVSDTSVGAPTPSATQSSQAKVSRLKSVAGPDSVVLTPNEVASLIGSSIDWSVRRMYDSLRVELQEGILVVHARLDTRALPPGTLGPFAGMMGAHEPLRMAGTLAIQRPGIARFTIKQITLHGIEFPGPLVQSIARQMAGASPDGSIPLKVDPSVSAVAIHPTAVILYRHKETR